MSKAMTEQSDPQTLLQYPQDWTYEYYTRPPDDRGQYEVVKGKLYKVPTPTPRHQKVAGDLQFALEMFVRQNNLGDVYSAPIDVMFPGRETPVQPDLVVVAAHQADIVGEEYIRGVPLVVIEVISVTSWWRDRRVKLELYETVGVPEFWLVDPIKKWIEVHVLQRTMYALLGHWEPGETAHSQVLRGFEIAVNEVIKS